MSSFVDVSGRVVLRLVGADGLDFIQRISTNDIAALQLGQSKQTILTNEKGRIIDVVTVHRAAESRLMLLGQSKDSAQLIPWIEKYIIMEDIHVEDLTSSTAQYLIYDYKAEDHVRFTSFSSPETIALSEEFGSLRLVRVISPRELKGSAEEALSAMDLTHRPVEEFEEFRVTNGIPGALAELTPQYNPLEANLGTLISWTKGCYIGQEVIARLDTYKKVQRHLVTMSMSALPDGLPISFQNTEGEAGVITSAATIAETGEIRGIGFLKTSGSDHPETYSFLKDGVKVPLQIHNIT
jgi:folate-binding protein YgfZ